MKKSLFGTDGIRAEVGTSPLTKYELTKIGYALGLLAQKNFKQQPRILLGYDTRISHSFIKKYLLEGLSLFPSKIYNGHVLPTPAIYQLVIKQQQFDLGIIITASHNPYYDNGIKIVSSQGKLSAEDENFIADWFFSSHKVPEINKSCTEEHIPQEAKRWYQETIATFFPPNLLKDTTVVLDCAHGATYRIAPTLFRSLGATVIPIGIKPTGKNINKECGSLFPATLRQNVIANKATIGFGFDGDGDRVIAVTRDGSIKDGDALLALLSNHHLYKDQAALVGTIMSNQALENYIQKQGKKFIRAAVGDKYVSAALQEHNLLLGGEPAGHIITRDYLTAGDGIFSALRILETLITTNSNVLETYTPYPSVLINVPVKEKKDLEQEPFSSIIAANRAKIPSGRIIIRYSGTENLLRILVEDQYEKTASNVANQLTEELKKYFYNGENL